MNTDIVFVAYCTMPALTSMNTEMVLIVCGAGEGLSAVFLVTLVRSFTCVNAHVHLPNVGGGEALVATFEWAFKGSLTCTAHR